MFKTDGLESLARQSRELRMSAPRSAALWAAAGLLIASSGPVRASDPPADLVLPEPPSVEVVVEGAPGTKPGALAPTAAAASPRMTDVPIPDLPEASVVLTVADRLAGAISARLADAQVQFAPRLGKKDREAIAAFYALGA